MKKMITMLMLLGTFAWASAQPRTNSSASRHEPAAQKRYSNDKSYYAMVKEKNEKLEAIDRRYDRQIAAIKANRRLSNHARKQYVQQLEKERREEIKSVEVVFNRSFNNNDWAYNNHRH